MNTENGPTVSNLQIPESQIIMTEKGPSFAGSDVPKATVCEDFKGMSTDKDLGQDRRATPGESADQSGQEQTSQYELKSMADKAAICIMRKVQLAIDAADWPMLDRLMPHVMKLLDAQMAMEWSIKWQRHILEKPQNLTALKAQSSLTAINQGRAVKARKQEKGDQRTTPKRLLKELPSDDAA